ncbi:hypothetical protein Pla175_08810 [Pirellulimonas nuda]|uniref:DUF1778 domain-containing protein n=1 Tax=Pirellulimonas nuda TaxID=2528009 RepID=A0A518D7S8_9BACT|nr:DUF1778 domain-containing protein [Pirellulimonas nuda]QDU87519.1 hypothetical protein Pla175_08810 [Pirellulimonas nuda]
MSAPESKTARLEARLPESVYDLLRSAAALQGRSVSDFVVSSARAAAEQAIANHDLIRLSLKDQQRFAEALLAPAKPVAALKRAAKNRRKLIEPS